MTSLECILRTSVLGEEDCLEADESPAAGETRWLGEAAAASGTESKDTRREEEARRNAEANTLAVGARSRAGAARVRDRSVVGELAARSGTWQILMTLGEGRATLFYGRCSGVHSRYRRHWNALLQQLVDELWLGDFGGQIPERVLWDDRCANGGVRAIGLNADGLISRVPDSTAVTAGRG